VHALAAPMPAPPVVEVCWVGVVPVDVLAAAPPVVAVLLAAPVPAPAPPVVSVPPAPVFPLEPTDEPPVVETLPLAAGIPALDPDDVDVDPEDEAEVDVDVDPVDVLVEVDDAAGGDAFPVVGTVNVGTAPVLTVPDPPPLPHAASATAALSTPAVARAVRMTERRTSMTSSQL
jgi:hypothetical protein